MQDNSRLPKTADEKSLDSVLVALFKNGPPRYFRETALFINVSIPLIDTGAAKKTSIPTKIAVAANLAFGSEVQ